MTREKVSFIGGARIGGVNATWPFATLTATRDSLNLNATLIGSYSFTPDQVISIEKYTMIPVLGWGIQIRHNVATQPRKIIFWWFFTPNTLVNRIAETGFTPHASQDSMPIHQGVPVRWQAVATIIVLWNVLFLLDIGFSPHLHAELGPFSFLAVFCLFLGSIAIWKAQWLQRCILKPGRSPSEIRAWLYLVAFVSGLISVGAALSVFVLTW